MKISRDSTLVDIRKRDFLDDVRVRYTTEKNPPLPGKFDTLDLRCLNTKTVLGVIGRRNSGKSTLVRDIIRTRFSHITEGVVVNGSESSNKFYSTFMPDTFVFCNAIDEMVLESYIHQAKKDPGTERLVVIDDQGFSSAQRRSQALREIVFNGRHYGMTLIIVAQSPQSLGAPSTRANVDYIFLTRENLILQIELAYKYFFGVFPKFTDFKNVCFEMKKVPFRTLFSDMSSFGGMREMVKFYTANPT